ncbi:MAG: hypothetical protein ACLGIB_02295 [Actinomycetota bacterium]
MRKLVLALLAGAALLGACTSDSSDVSSDGSIEVTVDGGEASGDTEARVATGTEVTIEVTSDADDRIHVHGYDLHADVSNGSGTVGFTADIPGVFEVELEEAGIVVVELTVE